ncbi:MAG: aspartate aminotransferase [Desulfuromonas sp. SDB]|nr:MAG: aspartate aminotransferase [Desulfuromonas sp. SDB]
MEKIKLSDRANLMPASPIRKLASYADQAKQRGIEVFHINIGQPDIATPQFVFEAMRSHQDRVIRYGPSPGLPELRQAISNYFNRFKLELFPEDIFVTQGGSEAIVFAMEAIANPGDNIVVFEPFYTNYSGFAKMAGVDLVPVPTHVEDGFRLPPSEIIEEKINNRTRGILICSPNNPTGTVYRYEELEMIVRIAQKHDLMILSDEVYREFVFDEKIHISILDIPHAEDRSVIMDSFSKRFSMCGARIGFLATKIPQLKDVFMRFSQARLCPATLEQIGVIAGLNHYDQFIPKMIKEYQKRRDIVFQQLSEIQGSVTLKPEGAFYCVVKLPVRDAEEFAKFMLTDFSYQQQTTMVAPAAGFYASEGQGVDEIRIAYVLEENSLRTSIGLLKMGIDAFNENKG